MLDFYRKYYKTVFDIALIALTVFLAVWIFSYLYQIAAPIFLSFIVFMVIEPIAKFLHKKGAKKSIATAVAMLLFVTVIIGVLFGAGALIVTQSISLSEKIPKYANILQVEIKEITTYLLDQSKLIPEDVMQRVIEFITNLTNLLGEWTGMLLVWFANYLKSFSTFVFNFLVALILAYFLSVEIDTWKKVARTKTPKTFKHAYFFLKENVFKGIMGYLKAQAKLVSITFVVIFLALLALRIENAFTIALFSGILDVLPVVGISTLFVPWIIYLFVIGNFTQAIWLTALWGTVISIRQVLEPKIIGDSLGVSAFTMLSFIIISLSLFGIIGLFVSPILIILLKSLYEQGYLEKWIRAPEDY